MYLHDPQNINSHLIILEMSTLPVNIILFFCQNDDNECPYVVHEEDGRHVTMELLLKYNY